MRRKAIATWIIQVAVQRPALTNFRTVFRLYLGHSNPPPEDTVTQSRNEVFRHECQLRMNPLLHDKN